MLNNPTKNFIMTWEKVRNETEINSSIHSGRDKNPSRTRGRNIYILPRDGLPLQPRERGARDYGKEPRGTRRKGIRWISFLNWDYVIGSMLVGRASHHGHPSLCPGKEHASCRGCGVRYSTPNTLCEGRGMRKPVGWDEGAFASVLGSLCYWKVAHCQMEVL